MYPSAHQHKTPHPQVSLLVWVNAQEIAFQSSNPIHSPTPSRGHLPVVSHVPSEKRILVECPRYSQVPRDTTPDSLLDQGMGRRLRIRERGFVQKPMSVQQESRGQVVRGAPTGAPSRGCSSCQLPPPAGTCVGSILSQWVPSSFVNKLLQALPPFFNKGLLKDPFVSSDRVLPLQGFPREWWYYNLAISLQLIF